MVYSIQEMVDKTAEQRKLVTRSMDKYAYFSPEDASIFTGQSRAVEKELRESIRRIPLKEFLMKSSTTGVAGAPYLIPDKLNDILYYSEKPFDITPTISSNIISGWEGGDLLIDIVKDGSMRGKRGASGAASPSTTANTVRATISPKLITANIAAAGTLMEDSQYSLIEWHIQQAAKSIGYQATELALAELIAASDGDGTLNSGTTGDADETRFTLGTTTDIVTAIRANGYDEFISNTLVCTSEAWGHSIGVHAAPVGWDTGPVEKPFNAKLGTLDVLFSNSRQLHAAAATDADEAAFTNCVSVVFDRANALLTGRKRWLQVENYADPVNDLVGAVVSCRQDSVTMYKDAIYVLTET